MEVKKIEAISGKFIVDKIKERSKDVDIIYLTEDIILDTNGVKQLAEYVEQLEKEKEELTQIYKLKVKQMVEYRDKNYISKSVIRDKIKETEQEDYFKKYYYDYQVNEYDFARGYKKCLKEILGE